MWPRKRCFSDFLTHLYCLLSQSRSGWLTRGIVHWLYEIFKSVLDKKWPAREVLLLRNGCLTELIKYFWRRPHDVFNIVVDVKY